MPFKSQILFISIGMKPPTSPGSILLCILLVVLADGDYGSALGFPEYLQAALHSARNLVWLFLFLRLIIADRVVRFVRNVDPV